MSITKRFSPLSYLIPLRYSFLMIIAALSIAGFGNLNAQTMNGLTADAEVNPDFINATLEPMRCGFVSGTGASTVLVFQLPSLPAGQKIGTATFTIYYTGRDSVPTYNGDLYGLSWRLSSSTLVSDHYAGALDSNATLIQDNFAPTTLGTTLTGLITNAAGSQALADYLSAQYSTGGTGQYVFIRISPDQNLLNNYTRYKFHSAEYSNASLRPVINYTTVPITYSISSSAVPLSSGTTSGDGIYNSGSVASLIATPNNNYGFVNWTENGTIVSTSTNYTFTVAGNRSLVANFQAISDNVFVGGGGAVTGVYADPTTSGRFFMKTDVGGIYRMDPGATQWKPISESFSFSGNGNAFGIESIAIDPNNAGVIYAYTGKYNYSSYSSHIYKSTNAGDTWSDKAIPTNLDGLANFTDHARRGEKLAIDPNNSNVLYLASMNVGLWKSVNGATSWTKVMRSGTTPFPIGSGSGQSTYGLSFVAFDKTAGVTGTVSSIAYVGVYDSTSGEGGVWKTTDGGSNWAQMTGGFTTPARGAVASDGTLYVTYYSNGGVCKAARNVTAFTACAPSSTVIFGALAIDPTAPQTVYVSQSDTTFGNTTWRTTNGGTNWTPVGNVHGFTNVSTRQSSQWFGRIGQVAINPFNTKEVWMGDWMGVLRTPDITNTAIAWDYIYQGHEEVVPLMLRSAPTGAPLLSGIADVNGMRHATIDAYPTASYATTSGVTNNGSTTGLDFCEGNTNFWVRVGKVTSGGVTAYTSSNNGVSWTAMPTIPSGADQGRVAVSATNTKNFVWKRLDGTVYYTTNSGTTWATSTGVPKQSSGTWDTGRHGLTSNRVNDGVFYSFGLSGTNASNGYVYRSTDKGATFTPISNAIYTGVAVNPTSYTLLAMPGNANELWLTVSSSGVYKSTDGGVTFNSVPGVSGDLLAFGKAAPGHSNPTVFVRGTGIYPAYRSDDDGATWVDVTDSANVPINNNAKLLGADAQVFGRYYVGTDGRGIYVIDSQ